MLIRALNEAGERQKDQDGDIDADVKPYMKPCRGPGFQNDATRLMIVRANVRPNPTWLIGPTAILIAEPFRKQARRQVMEANRAFWQREPESGGDVRGVGQTSASSS